MKVRETYDIASELNFRKKEERTKHKCANQTKRRNTSGRVQLSRGEFIKMHKHDK